MSTASPVFPVAVVGVGNMGGAMAAQAAGFEGPLGGSTCDVFARASAAGLADLDDAALLQWLMRPA